MTDAVISSLESSLPGVQLESVVQGFAFLNRFDEGIAYFEALASPTPTDHRWAGVCCFSTFDDERAIDLYMQAIQWGNMAARINLAHSLAFVDRGDEVFPQLEQVNFDALGAYDRVLYLRVKSLYDERNGNLHLALKQAETAWRLIQGIAEFPLLAPRLLNQLGILHGRIGRAQRALWYLDRNLEIAKDDERILVSLTRVRVLVALGRYEEAEQELLDLGDVPEQFHPIIQIRRAEMHWARGNLQTAVEHYRSASDLARQNQIAFEDFQSSIDLATLVAHENEKSLAYSYLKRAQRLISDRSDRLLFRFREVLVQAWFGEYEPAHAAAELMETAEQFGAMGLLQEQGWVRIHVANFQFLDRPATIPHDHLDALHALSITLQNSAFLDREWHFLPELRLAVADAYSSITPQ